MMMSHPSRVCGLKHTIETGSPTWGMSHPSRVCGLKLARSAISCDVAAVTPFAGVWIETLVISHFVCFMVGHTLRGCVD